MLKIWKRLFKKKDDKNIGDDIIQMLIDANLSAPSPDDQAKRPRTNFRNVGRPMTLPEIAGIRKRLKNLDAATAETYKYPVAHLIEHLLDRRYDELHRVEPVEGEAKTYYVDFSSPPKTWKMLCGRSGTYIINAETMEVTDFIGGMMN